MNPDEARQIFQRSRRFPVRDGRILVRDQEHLDAIREVQLERLAGTRGRVQIPTGRVPTSREAHAA